MKPTATKDEFSPGRIWRASHGPFETEGKTRRSACDALDAAIYAAVDGDYTPFVRHLAVHGQTAVVIVWRHPLHGWVYQIYWVDTGKMTPVCNPAHANPPAGNSARVNAAGEAIYAVIDLLMRPELIRTAADIPEAERVIMGDLRVSELLANARFREALATIRRNNPQLSDGEARRLEAQIRNDDSKNNK